MIGWNELNDTVIKNELCCLCGTCVGVCPVNAIKFKDEKISETENNCINCGKCMSSCPGIGFNYVDMNEDIFHASNENNNKDLGFYLDIKKGYACDEKIRYGASSGGIATAISLYLLENNIIDGVIGVVPEGKGYKAGILRTREEIIKAKQSKYVFIPVNEIIKQLLATDGKYLFVGLPCHIQGMRKAEKLNVKLEDKIFMYVGIFCGFNMSSMATDFLIKKSKISCKKIESIQYRGIKNGNTGFLIKSKDKDFFVSKHGYTILNAFYSKPRCWKCYDLTGEFADISLGDAWEMDGAWSRLIIRSKKAEDIINEMQNRESIFCIQSDIDDIYSTQKKLVNYKKHDIYTRQIMLKHFPDYNLGNDIGSGKVNFKAKIFMICLKLGQLNFIRSALGLLPIFLVEKVSIAMRKNTNGKKNLNEGLKYLCWGVITVVVGFVSFWGLSKLGMEYKIANIFSIVLTKMFAYITNKLFVFESKCNSIFDLVNEMVKFIISRGFSGIVEFVGLIVLVDYFKFNKIVGKGFLIVITTAINYFSGKNHVFKK